MRRSMLLLLIASSLSGCIFVDQMVDPIGCATGTHDPIFPWYPIYLWREDLAEYHRLSRVNRARGIRGTRTMWDDWRREPPQSIASILADGNFDSPPATANGAKWLRCPNCGNSAKASKTCPPTCPTCGQHEIEAWLEPITLTPMDKVLGAE